MSIQLIKLVILIFLTKVLNTQNPCKTDPKPAFSDCCHRPRLLDNRDFQGCERQKVYKNQATSVCSEYECFFIKNGLYLNSSMNVDAIQSYMIKVSRGDGNQRTDWQSIISSSVEKCVEKIMDTVAVLRELFNENPFNINPYECDVAFVSVMNCIYYDIFVNCPGVAWEKTLACDDWKEYISTCMDDVETFPLINMNKMFG